MAAEVREVWGMSYAVIQIGGNGLCIDGAVHNSAQRVTCLMLRSFAHSMGGKHHSTQYTTVLLHYYGLLNDASRIKSDRLKYNILYCQ